MNKNNIIEKKPIVPIIHNEIAQGKRNEISRSKIKKV
jgi:hypothetical protein